MQGNIGKTNQIESNQRLKVRVPIDKKLRLAQHIRQENMDNRMKIRQRERLLYGTEASVPLWEKGSSFHAGDTLREGMDASDVRPEETMPDAAGSFKLRMTVAIFLFIGFLLCDAGQYKIFGYTTGDLYGMIAEDYFQINDPENAKQLPQLSELLQLDLSDL